MNVYNNRKNTPRTHIEFEFVQHVVTLKTCSRRKQREHGSRAQYRSCVHTQTMNAYLVYRSSFVAQLNVFFSVRSLPYSTYYATGWCFFFSSVLHFFHRLIPTHFRLVLQSTHIYIKTLCTNMELIIHTKWLRYLFADSILASIYFHLLFICYSG